MTEAALMTKRQTCLTFLVAAMGLLATPLSAQRPETMTWSVAGGTRRAIVYRPSATASGQSPLVFSFHGRGDNTGNFQHTNMHLAWPEAIVVYFEGLPTRDGLSGWQVEKGQDGDRDLKLVDAALAALRAKFQIDETRVYATGFSNGGNLTYLLWAERPGLFAAFAPVAARMRPSVQPKEPRPIVHIGGTQDPQILFTDQQAAIERARRVNGVTGTGTPCGSGCTLYGSSAGSPVMTWIHPGGHTYPPMTSERIAKFFREHPRRPQ